MRTPRKKSGLKHPETRSLKIQPKHRFNRWSTTIVPELKLCGQWLERSGFEVNSRVTVHTSKEMIVIRLEKAEE